MVLVSKDRKTYARNISVIQPFFRAAESLPRTKTNLGAKVLKTPSLTYFSLSRIFPVVQTTVNTSVVAFEQTDLISFDDAVNTQGNDTELNITTEEHQQARQRSLRPASRTATYNAWWEENNFDNPIQSPSDVNTEKERQNILVENCPKCKNNYKKGAGFHAHFRACSKKNSSFV